MEYIISNFAQALPMSFLGIVAPFFFRKKMQYALIAGIAGAISLPIISYFVLAPSPDILLPSAIYGVIFGWGWAKLAISKENKTQKNTREPISPTSIKPTSTISLTRTDLLQNSVSKEPVVSSSEPDVDVSTWARIREYDKSVSAAFEQIKPLGEPWVSNFVNQVVAITPKDRDADAIAKQICNDYEKNLRISENDAINAAYAEVNTKYGALGKEEFKEIYAVVGDAMDLETVLTNIANSIHEDGPKEELPETSKVIKVEERIDATKVAIPPEVEKDKPLTIVEWIVVLSISGGLVSIVGPQILKALGG